MKLFIKFVLAVCASVYLPVSLLVSALPSMGVRHDKGNMEHFVVHMIADSKKVEQYSFISPPQ